MNLSSVCILAARRQALVHGLQRVRVPERPELLDLRDVDLDATSGSGGRHKRLCRGLLDVSTWRWTH